MIHIYKSLNNQFYYVITARNGKVLLTSETYKQRAGAYTGIAAISKLFNSAVEIKDHTR